MPKRRTVIKKISKAAMAQGMTFVVRREGANHTIYSLDGLIIPIARHAEFSNRNAEGVFKECESKLGRGWWR